MYQHGKSSMMEDILTDVPLIHEDEEIPMDKGMAFDLYQKQLI